MYTEEKTFLNLIGALDQEAAVAGECLFVDPISDLAVVGAPDGEMFPEDREAWEMLLDPLPAFPVGDFRDTAPVLLHSLDCTWQEARAKGRPGRGIWLENARSIEGGMSGSPIVLADGAAVGVLSVSGGNATGHTKGGPQPRLRANLPGWLLAAAR